MNNENNNSKDLCSHISVNVCLFWHFLSFVVSGCLIYTFRHYFELILDFNVLKG